MADIKQGDAHEFLNGILIHDGLTGVFSGTDDPTTSGGTAAPLGSIYLQQGTNGITWVKYDSADTDWRQISTSTDLGAYLPLAGGTMSGDITTPQQIIWTGGNGATNVDIVDISNGTTTTNKICQTQNFGTYLKVSLTDREWGITDPSDNYFSSHWHDSTNGKILYLTDQDNMSIQDMTQTGTTTSTAGLLFKSNVPTTGSTAFTFDSANTLIKATSKLLSLKNAGVEKAYVDAAGEYFGQYIQLLEDSDTTPAIDPNTGYGKIGVGASYVFYGNDGNETNIAISPYTFAVSSAHTITASVEIYNIYLCNATSGAFAVELQDVANMLHSKLTFKKTDSSANAVTIDVNSGSGNLIDGASSVTLTKQYQVIEIVSDGTSWHVVANYVEFPTFLTDADGDTKIQVEESSDEDIIRFDAASQQMMNMTSNALNIGTGDECVIKPSQAITTAGYIFDTATSRGTSQTIAEFGSGGSIIASLGGTGHLSLGSSFGTAVSASHIIRAGATLTSSAKGIYGELTDSDASAHAYDMEAIQGSVISTAAGNNTGTLSGGYFDVNHTGSGTLTAARGVYANVDTTGTITTGYGVYIDSIAGGTSYGLYQSSASNENFLAGKTSIGSASDCVLDPDVTDGASAVAYTFDTVNTLNNSSAALASFKNNGTDYFVLNRLGGIHMGTTPNDDDCIDILAQYSDLTANTDCILMTAQRQIASTDNSFDFANINSAFSITGSSTGGVTGTSISIKSTADIAITSNEAITNLYAGYFETDYSGSTGTLTTAYAGYFNGNLTGSGTITTGYGIYIDSISGSTTYGLYQASSTNQNYLAGKTEIGSANDCIIDPDVADGSSAIAYRLDTSTTLSNTTAKLLSVRNNNSEQFYLRADGSSIFRGRVRFAESGGVSSDSRLIVDEAGDYSAETNTAMRAIVTDQSTTTNTHHLYAFWADGSIDQTAAVTNSGSFRGFYDDTRLTTASTLNTLYGYYSIHGISSGGTGTITNRYGIRLSPSTGSGTITNSYGIRLDAQNGSTNSYGIYQAGSNDENYFNGNTGFGDFSPNSGVEINTSLALQMEVITANTTTSGQTILSVGTASGTYTITLSTADTVEGRIVIIKDQGGNAGTNNITVDTEGSQTIDGASSVTLSTNYDKLILYCNGSHWYDIT